MIKRVTSIIISVLRNSLLLLPNIIKGDWETRRYVFQSWVHINFSLLLPYSRKLSELILYIRILINRLNNGINHDKETFNFSDYVDVVYINLEDRKDRNSEMISQFNKMGIENYIRFNAIENNNGVLGCAMSHKSVLENWVTNTGKILLICEDDVLFNVDKLELSKTIENFINNEKLDVVCLAYNHFNSATINDVFCLTSNTQTTSCYLIKQHMKDVLIRDFSLSIKLIDFGISNEFNIALDLLWKRSQKTFNFVIPKKRIAQQRGSYSNIEKRYVNYGV